MNWKLVLCCAQFFGLASSVWAQGAGPAGSETLIAEIKDASLLDPDSFRISADARHVAFRTFLSNDEIAGAQKQISEVLQERYKGRNESAARDLARAFIGGVSRMVIDGKPQKAYPEVEPGSLVFSPDGTRVAYVVGDGKKKHWVVVDGLDDKLEYDWVHDLGFTSDGKQLVYVGEHRDPKGDASRSAQVVVVNGREQKPYRAIAEQQVHRKHPASADEDEPEVHIVFSGSGGRYAYAAYDGKDMDRFFVIVDGKEEGPFQSSDDFGLVFSPDGKRVAYGVRQEGKSMVVVDGVPQVGVWKLVGRSLHFSPDSGHTAFIRRSPNEGQSVVFEDGKRQKNYSTIPLATLTFTPDGKRFGYSVDFRNGRGAVVLDGKEIPYPGIIEGPVFSPDGSRVTFRVGKIGESHDRVMVDDKEAASGQGWKTGLWFSPDSKRFACAVLQNALTRIFVDGEKYVSDEDIETFCFSPDSRRFAYISKSRNMKERLFIDGNPTPFEGYVRSFQFLRAGHRYIYVGRRFPYDFVVVDGRPQKTWSVILPARTPNIQIESPTRFHYIARRDNKVYAVKVDLE